MASANLAPDWIAAVAACASAAAAWADHIKKKALPSGQILMYGT
jgi:hypothetical protein